MLDTGATTARLGGVLTDAFTIDAGLCVVDCATLVLTAFCCIGFATVEEVTVLAVG